MTKLEILKAFDAHASLSLGVMFECAVDNAGFDGQWMRVKQENDDDAINEIYRHLLGIVDGHLYDKATPEEYAEAWIMLHS